MFALCPDLNLNLYRNFSTATSELAMMRFTLLSLLVASPMLVSAGLFAKDSGVTMLDEKSFRQVMKEEVSMLSVLNSLPVLKLGH